MIIISDTSCISNLAKINALSILQTLFNEIVIPFAVYEELSMDEEVGVIIRQISWIKIMHPSNKNLVEELLKILDEGEANAIALAIENSESILLIDEQTGRSIAKQKGINIMGIIGVLLKAKDVQLISLIKPTLDALVQTSGFWISPSFYNKVLQLANEQ